MQFLRISARNTLTSRLALWYNPFVPKIKTDKSGPGANIRAERAYAKSIGVSSPTRLNKEQLDEAVRRRELELGITREKHSIYDYTSEERSVLETGLRGKHRTYNMVSGYFRAFPEGDGTLLRDPFADLSDADIYVPASRVKACDMREGDRITGTVAVLFYNKLRVLKNVMYVDGDSKVRSAARPEYSDLAADVPSRKIDILGNHSMVAVIDRVIGLGMGESLVVSGRNGDNAGYFAKSASAVFKGLRAGFDGVVYGIFAADAKERLGMAYDPDTTMLGDSAEKCAFMREMIRRTLERNEHAVVVTDNDGVDISPFLAMAKAYRRASVTVISFTAEPYAADARVVFDGALIDCAETGNTGTSRISGPERARAAFRALQRIGKATPDELLGKFTEYVNEDKQDSVSRG